MPCPVNELLVHILDQIVTTEVFLDIFSELVNQLTDDKLAEGYLQPEGVMYHTSNANMKEIESYFGE